METMPDWSGLIPDLLVQIATNLQWEDFTVFRGVCTAWREAVGPVTKKKYQRYLATCFPILMLADKCNHKREFYSLSRRKICARLNFHEAESKKCIEVGFGWILTVSASLSGLASNGRLRLVKTFDCCPKIKLPNLKRFKRLYEVKDYPEISFFKMAMLLADPSETSDFMLVVLTARFLMFWRNGDRQWTKIKPEVLPNPRCTFLSMVYYQGNILALDRCAQIWIWDPSGIDITDAQVILQLNVDDALGFCPMLYPVESTDGELLIIGRNNHIYPAIRVRNPGADCFGVMRVDVERRMAEDISGVGKDAIFVGNNATLAVAAADYPGVLRPNCIYFTDDCVRPNICCSSNIAAGKDMGVYYVESKSTERFGIESCSKICPPMWIFPSFREFLQ